MAEVTQRPSAPVSHANEAEHRRQLANVVNLINQTTPDYSRTDAEIAAGVTPVDFRYPEGDVRRYGAVGDGSANDSAAWTAAINVMGEAGGGTVTCQPGVRYIVEGLPLRERVYLLLRGSRLRLPSSPSQAMFIAEAGTDFVGGGIIGGELDGRNNTQDCMDFSGRTQLTRFLVDDVLIDNFDRGYVGSNNDRFPMFRACRIHDNNVGVYVRTNHPIFDHCDFRNNDVGLRGQINDCYAVGCKFNFNRVGIEPDPNQGQGRIRNSYFVGCMFFGNEELGIRVSRQCWISSCLFVGVDDGDTGIVLEERDCRVTDCQFGHDAFVPFGGACISMEAGGGATIQRMLIANNTFRLNNTGGTGVGITTNEDSCSNLMVQGNQVVLGAGRKWIVISTLTHPMIDGNSVQVEGAGMEAGNGIIEIGQLSSIGGNITNNVFASLSAGTGGSVLQLPNITDCIIANNKFLNFDDAIDASSGTPAARFSNNVASPGGLTAAEQGEVHSTGNTGGADSAGSGNQYVELTIRGTTYKILHDGTVS